jgi:hypothetical protein
MERQIRAVGPRGVIFISEATARNAKFLAKYGIMVDDEKFGKTELSTTKIGKVINSTQAPIQSNATQLKGLPPEIMQIPEIPELPKKKGPKAQPKQD